ncbi:MAG: universal stress protein [Verrucomicrobia bacterium]|nr:universal stress protein [Verrucomicrobiota bacterium]
MQQTLKERQTDMKIICGTDFSVHANEAALTAATLAARLGETLTLVHVLDPSRYSNPSKELMDHLRDNRQKKLNPLIERVKRRAARVEARVVEGTPATKLTDLAKATDAQLLVVSANGQIAPSKWFVGSITDQAVQSSSIPVLVVRNPSGLKNWAYDKRPLQVIVGYDYSASAEVALRWAASLREIAPCEITVVYVASAVKERARLGIAPPMSSIYYPSGIKQFLAKELKQKCDSIFGENGAKVRVLADWGRPDSHLIEVAADSRADLLVVGTSQRRGLARLGSVSRAVLHYAHMNVACVPAAVIERPAQPEQPQFNRVLVPIDFTDAAAQAISLAYASVRNGGEVRLIHVMPPTQQNGNGVCKDGQGRAESQKLSARLEGLIPKAAANRGITTQREVVEHHEPAAAISQAANRFDADLICMGSRGRSGFKETIFGSVSQDVMAQSKRAVLVLRGNERRQCADAMKNEPIKCGV